MAHVKVTVGADRGYDLDRHGLKVRPRFSLGGQVSSYGSPGMAALTSSSSLSTSNLTKPGLVDADHNLDMQAPFSGRYRWALLNTNLFKLLESLVELTLTRL